MRRPVFKLGTKDAQNLDDGVYNHWDEQSYEHSDSIISVEANASESTQAKQARLLTASKDGALFIWSFNTTPDEDLMKYVADAMLDEPLTRAKWLTESSILVATTYGNIYLFKV